MAILVIHHKFLDQSHINSSNKYTLYDVLAWKIYVIYCSMEDHAYSGGGGGMTIWEKGFTFFFV